MSAGADHSVLLLPGACLGSMVELLRFSQEQGNALDCMERGPICLIEPVPGIKVGRRPI